MTEEILSAIERAIGKGFSYRVKRGTATMLSLFHDAPIQTWDIHLAGVSIIHLKTLRYVRRIRGFRVRASGSDPLF